MLNRSTISYPINHELPNIPTSCFPYVQFYPALPDSSLISEFKGVGDFLGKAIAAKVTKESAAKPEYSGNGLLMLEPTYKHILLENITDWGSMVLEDGLFLACESTVKQAPGRR